jgi:hypothetical protein
MRINKVPNSINFFYTYCVSVRDRVNFSVHAACLNIIVASVEFFLVTVGIIPDYSYRACVLNFSDNVCQLRRVILPHFAHRAFVNTITFFLVFFCNRLRGSKTLSGKNSTQKAQNFTLSVSETLWELKSFHLNGPPLKSCYCFEILVRS